MKKIILMAAFAAAGLVSAKNSEVKITEKKTEKTEKAQEAFRLCGVAVTYYDPKGNVSGTDWFVIDAPTLSSCQAYQSFVLWNLTQSGYHITP